MVDDLARVLNGQKLDYVVDEWMWIPLNWPTDKHFYHHDKWENIMEMARANLLNPGCKVIVPFHMNAVETFFGPDVESRLLWHNLCFWFEASVLPFDNKILCEENPLWAATEDGKIWSELPEENKDYFEKHVTLDLQSKNVKTTLGSLHFKFDDLRNECNWKEVEPWPAFLVLTLKNELGAEGLVPNKATRKRQMARNASSRIPDGGNATTWMDGE